MAASHTRRVLRVAPVTACHILLVPMEVQATVASRNLQVLKGDLARVVCHNLELIALERTRSKDLVPWADMDYHCRNQVVVHILQQVLLDHKSCFLARLVLVRKGLLYRNPFAETLLFLGLVILENSWSRSSIDGAWEARIDPSVLHLVQHQNRLKGVEDCRIRLWAHRNLHHDLRASTQTPLLPMGQGRHLFPLLSHCWVRSCLMASWYLKACVLRRRPAACCFQMSRM